MRIILACLCIFVAGCYRQTLALPAIHEASRTGDVKEVSRLLGQGISPNSLDSRGDPPIFWALVERRWRVADLLLKRGANLNHLDMDNKTLLKHFEDCGSACSDVVSWLKKASDRNVQKGGGQNKP